MPVWKSKPSPCAAIRGNRVSPVAGGPARGTCSAMKKGGFPVTGKAAWSLAENPAEPGYSTMFTPTRASPKL